MEEEDSSGVGWPHDLLLMRDKARASLQQLQAADVYAAWMDNVQAAVNTTMPWPDMPKRASFGFSGSAHSLAAAGKTPKPQSPNPQPPTPPPNPQPQSPNPNHQPLSHITGISLILIERANDDVGALNAGAMHCLASHSYASVCDESLSLSIADPLHPCPQSL